TGSAKPVGAWAGFQPLISQGRTIWIVDAHRDDGRHFIVRADEKLSAFVELESAISRGYTLLMRKRLKATIPAKGKASHKVEKRSGTPGVSDTSSKYQVPVEGPKK